MSTAVLVAAGVVLLVVILLVGTGGSPRRSGARARVERRPGRRTRGARRRPGIIPTTDSDAIVDDSAPSRSDDL